MENNFKNDSENDFISENDNFMVNKSVYTYIS